MLSAGRRLASYDSIEGLSVRFRADKWEMVEGGLLPSLSLRVLASRLADMPRESPRPFPIRHKLMQKRDTQHASAIKLQRRSHVKTPSSLHENLGI